jgi:hypothetical protein
MEKVNYVIEDEVRVEPFITWVSKGQIMWGNGRHWREAEDWVKAGLFKHVGIKRPTDSTLEYQISQYGYCMPWPPPSFPPMLGKVMRPDFVNQWVDGKKYTDLRFFWGLGYIDEEGKLLDQYGNGIAGYFIFLADPEARKDQQFWLENQPEWLRKQWIRCFDTYIRAVDYQVKVSQRKILVGQRLLGVEEYKELDARIDDDKIEWRKKDN